MSTQFRISRDSPAPDALLEAAFESTADALIVLDASGRVRRLNTAAEALTGWTAAEADGRAWNECVRLSSQPADTVPPPGEHDGLLASRDGRLAQAHLRVEHVSHPGGDAAAGVLLTLRGARTSSELANALVATEERLRIALASGQVGLWEWEPEAGRVRFSPEWLALFGYPPDTLFSDRADILRIVHPDDAAHIRERLLAVLSGDTDDIDLAHRFAHRDGHYIDVLSRGKVVERAANGRVVRVVGTHTDVTELKRTQGALHASRSFLETVIDAIPERVFWKDAAGRYLGANRQFAADVGAASPREIVGRTDADMPWRDKLEEVREDDRRVLSGTLAKHVTERVLPTGEGDRWVEISKVPLTDARGDIVGVLGLGSDLTDRRAREEQLRIVADALTSGTEERLLTALTRAAAELAGASVAFVSRTNGDGTATVSACHPNGEPLKHLTYDLPGTPCADALSRRACLVPAAVQAQYPEDELLATWSIEGYAGRALAGTDDATIGLFVLMFDRPVPDESRVETVIDIFAARAAAELERERTHGELRASEARLNAAIEGGNQGVWEWEPDSDRFVGFGHQFRALGYADATELKSAAQLTRHVHPQDVPRLRRAVRQYFAGIKPVCEIEIRLRYADGSHRWTLMRGKAVEQDRNGRVLRMMGTLTDITALKQSQSAAERAQTLLEAAVEGGEQGIWEWDPDTDELLSFGGCARALGIDIDSAVITGALLLDRLHPDDRPAMWDAQRAYFRGERPVYEFEGRMRDKDGIYRWMLLRGKASEREDNGHVLRMLGTLTDISSLKDAQAGLETSQRFLELIIDTVPQGIFWQDCDGRYTGCNRNFAELAGLANPESIVGLSDHDLSWAELAEDFRTEDSLLLNGTEPYLHAEWPIARPDGTPRWLELVKVAIRDDAGAAIGMLGAYHDISERKLAEQEAQRLALYDPLTNLPNRRYFTERLESSLAAASRRGSAGALLFIDLDQFKQINDSLGHAVGDALLQAVAQRLEHVTRTEDVVARLGGDEFVVLLPDLAGDMEACATQAQLVAGKIRASLGDPFQFEHHQFHVTPTMGISLFPERGKTADDVLKEADTAMYSGKAAGRNMTRFFRREMEEGAQERLRLETDLRHALERGEFEVFYQPQVDRTGQVTGAEALLRWHHPDRGLVPPGVFIPVAEERGLIVDIGRWVFDAAFSAYRAWMDSSSLDVGELAINVSSRQLRDERFVEDTEALLARHRIPSHRIVFELTESTVVEDVEATISLMERLRRLGICFALDDFGIGYSSLSYLKRLPIDHLKIDRSFIADIGRDRNDEVICQTIVAMAQHLGLKTIAEGVETTEQFEFLKALRCDGYQGYLFLPPVNEQAFLGHCRMGSLDIDL